VPHGGQNLLEPGALGRPVLFGPHIHNFRDIADRMATEGAALAVADAEALGEAVARLLSDDTARAAMGAAAVAVATSEAHVLDDYLAALAPVLPGTRRDAGA
jgi:3-deoxy-D-manno-octulosonic-acid transferase